MHHLSALFEVFRRLLPAGADTHLAQAEEHMREAIRSEVRSEVVAEVRSEVSTQLAPVVELILTTVKESIAALGTTPSPPSAAPAAPTGTGSDDPLQPGSQVPSAA